MEYIKFVNQSRFQGFCGPIKISGVHKLKILQFWDFYLFNSIFFHNLFPKWYLRPLLFIQPISVSELSEVECKSMVQLLIVSKVPSDLNYWK